MPETSLMELFLRHWRRARSDAPHVRGQDPHGGSITHLKRGARVEDAPGLGGTSYLTLPGLLGTVTATVWASDWLPEASVACPLVE
jgi:hypothetical protein